MDSLSLSAAIVLCFAGPAISDNTPGAAGVKADNARANKEIRQNGEATADQQGQSEADRKITQEIRQAVVKNKSLSRYAHNVKIITRDGKVTLMGPVRSKDERLFIEKAAGKIAGTDRVTSELQVAAKRAKAAKASNGGIQ